MHGGFSWRLLAALLLLVILAAFVSRMAGDSAVPIFVGALLLAFLVGSAGYYYKPVPWVGASLVLVAYLGLLGWSAADIGVIDCPRCEEHDGFSRIEWFTFTSIIFGFFGVILLAIIGAGALIGSWLRRAREQ